MALKRHILSGKESDSSCLNDTSNYLVQNYHTWSSTPPYCDYLKRRPDYSSSQLLLIYKCNENLTKSQTPECLKPIDHYHYSAKAVDPKSEPNSSFPEYYLNNYPDYIFYINALHDGVVNAETIKMLGINPKRLVKGDIRAKIVYLPQVTSCGYPNQHSAQLVSRLYR